MFPLIRYTFATFSTVFQSHPGYFLTYWTIRPRVEIHWDGGHEDTSMKPDKHYIHESGTGGHQGGCDIRQKCPHTSEIYMIIKIHF